ARQIAAHANAARGSQVDWIIGLDDQRALVTGTGGTDVADWWARTAKWFDGQPPGMEPLRVHTRHGGDVVLLRFDTTRAPFLITNPSGGAPEREVPWREGTRTRSAFRDELLRLLVPRLLVPAADGVGFRLTASRSSEGVMRWSLGGRIFFAP